MWIKYWILILLALVAGILAYAHNDPFVGGKVGAALDLVRAETAYHMHRIWAIIDAWMKGR
jgi:hypothetical protein